MIPYMGGKSALAKWVISHFPNNYKDMVYCEVFGGGGWVLFKKDQSVLEIYNDLNSQLVNLFKVIRDDYESFNHKCQWSLHSREMFKEAREKLKDDEFLNDIEKAMHYAISQVQAFSGCSGWGYVLTADKIVSGKWLPFVKRLDLINARLKRVQIEQLDFEKVITKYDSDKTLFYLDPPYVEKEFYYNKYNVRFGKEDHYRLAELLKSIKGKFVLSYYDHEVVRDLYKEFRIETKQTTKASRGNSGNFKNIARPKAIELLITN